MNSSKQINKSKKYILVNTYRNVMNAIILQTDDREEVINKIEEYYNQPDNSEFNYTLMILRNNHYEIGRLK